MDRCALYLVRDHYSGAVKIGISNDPSRRLKEIADHYAVGRVSIVQTTWFTTRSEARSWESKFHNRYQSYRSPEQGGREWFDLTTEHIQGFIDWMEASTNRRAVRVISVGAKSKKSEKEIQKHRFQAFLAGTGISLFTGCVPAIAYAFTGEAAALFAAPMAIGGIAATQVKKEKELKSSYLLNGQPVGDEIPKQQYVQMRLWAERHIHLETVKPVGWELPQATTPESATDLYGKATTRLYEEGIL